MPIKTVIEQSKTQDVFNKTLDATNTVHRKIDDPNSVARTIADVAGDIPTLKDFGGVPGQDASTALQRAIDWLPSSGGMILGTPGIWYFSTKIVPTKPVILIGCGDTTTRFIKKTSSFGNLNHFLESEHSVGLYNLGIETETDLDQNYEMNAVRLDLDGTGLSGRRMHVENCRILGFNTEVYADGGPQYGLDFQTIKASILKASGPLSHYIGSCLFGNRVTNLCWEQVEIDQNFTGEHGAYCFGPMQVDMRGLDVKNAVRTESHSIKLVGDGAGPSVNFRQWILDNIVSENCFHGILLSVYNSERIHNMVVRDTAYEGITGSDNINGDLAFYMTGTAKIDQITVDTARFNDTSRQTIHFSGAEDNRIEQINLNNIAAKGWSGVSAGLHAMFGTSGLLTVGQLNMRAVRANGQIGGVNHGRSVVNPNTLTGIERINFEDVEEINVTDPALPVVYTDNNPTPSMRIGTAYYINYQSPVNMTGLANMRRAKIYTLYFANNLVTMIHGATMVMKGGSSVQSASGMVKQFFTHDGVVAYEVG